MSQKNDIETIISGNAILGIELGSTRIKAVLINQKNQPIVSGEYGWENRYQDDNWTYDLDDVWNGIQQAYEDLVNRVYGEHSVRLTKVAAIGVSGMMHGYLAFDEQENLLTPFRTWRNNYTSQASNVLMELFNHPTPQRWSISHLYQAILNTEPHVTDLDFITTLAGYVHWQLTGKKVLGIGDASGMFPIDITTGNYYGNMLNKFDQLVAEKQYSWKIFDILPKPLKAGQEAGQLTKAGALKIDPSGRLQAGCSLCPPEGDAGTGMVATNSVAANTGNVSAGTSIFAMLVLEGTLSQVYPELDLVTTPDGKLVAMAHSNNCTSNIDAWVSLFRESMVAMGIEVDINKLYSSLYNQALLGDKDCGGLLAYGYTSGEHITGFEQGRPLFVCSTNSRFNLANFMRVNLQSSFGAMKIGIDMLVKQEGLKLEKIMAHGGLFKTPGVAQALLAGTLNAPVAVMDTAGEGGAWGIALLASYRVNNVLGETLAEFLNDKVFAHGNESVIVPTEADVNGAEQFMQRYKRGLVIEQAAVDNLV
ncbi:FGGY-family carbohydrate kinase [Vibrio sp. SA48]|uniref:xylulokinase n=1 Tax=Vibrio sp. S12_S33 TaxID=2720223 RepID=UPI001783BD4D|nr:FGGY-family carbohydrate kinase [Vibrio sp. S12_S33]MBD1565532.1 ATPase [Vibrio sp. S12_S33]